MKIDRIRTDRAPRSNPEPRKADLTIEAKHQDKAARLRVRTGLRAGDIYLQWPRGSNNPRP